jgi:hypothetical protein
MGSALQTPGPSGSPPHGRRAIAAPRRSQGTSALVVLALAVELAGCAHTMIVETDPAGALVTIDGEPVGEGPVITRQFTSTGGRLHVTAAADHYEPVHVVVTQSEWFLWPAIVAVTPFLGVPFVVIPFIGPVITIGWAIVTSPTLLSLVFLQKYPDRVKLTLRPKMPGAFLVPSDSWLIPDDYDPNPPPFPRAPEPEATPPADPARAPLTEPIQQPLQPEGGNPVP